MWACPGSQGWVVAGACREGTQHIRQVYLKVDATFEQPSGQGETGSALGRRKFLSMPSSLSLAPVLRRELSFSMALLARRPSLSKLFLAALRACCVRSAYGIIHAAVLGRYALRLCDAYSCLCLNMFVPGIGLGHMHPYHALMQSTSWCSKALTRPLNSLSARGECVRHSAGRVQLTFLLLCFCMGRRMHVVRARTSTGRANTSSECKGGGRERRAPAHRSAASC